MSRYDHTPFPHRYIQLNENAELYRLGLLSGWFTLGEVTAWAERIVAGVPDPHPLLAELLASRVDSREEAARLLAPLAEGADTGAAKRRIVALLHERLMQDAASARAVAGMVVRLADAAGDLDLYAAGCGWKDELALAGGGVFGSVFGAAEVVREMLAELAHHALPAPPGAGIH